MIVLGVVLLILVGMFLSGLFSGAETGAYQFNRTRHRLALAEGGGRAQLVQRLTSNLTAFVVVCLIGTNLANALVSYTATLACENLIPPLVLPSEWLVTLIVGPILFVVGELAPKELFRRHPDRLMYASAPAIGLAELLFRPFAWVLGTVTILLSTLGLRADEGGGGADAERLRHAIAAGAEAGTLSDYQTTLARNIVSLSTRTVRTAMVPLERVDCIEVSADIEQARVFARQNGRGRFPVYRRRREQALGVIDMYELLFEERPGLTVRNYVQPALEVEPTERVAEALLRLRQARTNLAVVTSRGEALGIITIKDLVEEITGELRDL